MKGALIGGLGALCGLTGTILHKMDDIPPNADLAHPELMVMIVLIFTFSAGALLGIALEWVFKQ
jgi:hypothetical protein